MTAKKPPPRRYPMAPLLALTGMSESAFARLVWLSGTTLKNAREHGFVESAADRYACRAGFHPSQVWPDFAHDVCALEDCDELFRPRRPGHIYHDQKCARKAWARSPKGKASLKAAKDRWLVTAREYDRARERARKRRVRAEQRGEVAA